MNLPTLWQSPVAADWEQALERYWHFVLPQNLELERKLAALQLQTIEQMSANDWYTFLRREYFRWKYTAANRYATTTRELRRYIEAGELEQLNAIKGELLTLDPSDIRAGLRIASKIRGLGTAGASGLLSLLYPQHFGTVDQFAVKALREIKRLPQSARLAKMNENSLKLADGECLVEIMRVKARSLAAQFCDPGWTPRKVDMILWTYGRN
jgi:hypothetical protein